MLHLRKHKTMQHEVRYVPYPSAECEPVPQLLILLVPAIVEADHTRSVRINLVLSLDFLLSAALCGGDVEALPGKYITKEFDNTPNRSIAMNTVKVSLSSSNAL
jgi:hypothetical protein